VGILTSLVVVVVLVQRLPFMGVHLRSTSMVLVVMHFSAGVVWGIMGRLLPLVAWAPRTLVVVVVEAPLAQQGL
jgi:hypothetical protein